MGFGTKMAIGGALAGIGQGMVNNAQNDMEAKRQAALEAMKAEYRREDAERDHNYRVTEIGMQADLNDRNDARKTERGLNSDIVKEGVQHKNNVELKKIEFGNSKALTQFKADLDLRNDKASAQLKDSLENGDVKQVFEGGDGYYYATYGDGSIRSTGVTTPPPETFSSFGPTTTPPAKPQSAAPAPKPSGQAGKTYSQADAVATAKKHGVSVDEVHRRMKLAGYTLSGN